MPDDEKMIEIKQNFEIPSKCPKPKYWTQWASFTDLSKTDNDGNDYETLDRHRSKFNKFVIYKIKTIMHYYFSICEHPTEIDSREIETGYDWAYTPWYYRILLPLDFGRLPLRR